MNIKTLTISFAIMCTAVSVNITNNALHILSKESVVYGISTVVKKDSERLCYRELSEFKESVGQRHPWALKVLDSSGTRPPGFYMGNNLWLGYPSQCEDTMNREPFQISPELRPKPTKHDFPPYPVTFAVAYFHYNNTLQFHGNFPQEYKLQIGLCIPATCTVSDLEDIVKLYLNTSEFTPHTILDLNLQLMRVKVLNGDLDWIWTTPNLLIMYTVAFNSPKLILLFTIGISLVIFGSCFHVFKKKQDENCNLNKSAHITKENASNREGNELAKSNTLEEILLGFSIFANTRAFLKTKTSNNGNNIPMLNGLRVFGMFWVITVHTVFFQQDFNANAGTGIRLSEQFFNQILSNSTYCVDTFLLMSGFLVGYLFYKSRIDIFKRTKQPGSALKSLFEWTVMLVYRYLRLTPVYIYTLALTTILTNYFYHESVFDPTERNDILCETYWWRNLLYINNLYPRKEMCVSWSWYLSVDLQLFMLSTVILSISTRYSKSCISLIVILIITCMGVMSYSSYISRYTPFLDQQYAKMDAIYDLPWHRMGPYLVGVLSSYVYVVVLKEKLIMSKRKLITCWIIFPLLNLWIIFAIYGRKMSLQFAAFYMGVSRTLWGVGIAWVVIACATDNAGLINGFLSHPLWIPLSRISYCAYLINPLVIMQGFFADSILNISFGLYLIEMCGNLVLTYLTAFVFYILFECPYVVITKKLMKSISHNHSNRTKTVSTDTTNFNIDLPGNVIKTKI